MCEKYYFGYNVCITVSEALMSYCSLVNMLLVTSSI